ncbi:MAG: UPF0179 family protein [Methanocalculaceae archaeon]|jgi:uncharacterized protein (UPF0179 family)|nr:UPF0179 family protein [Methanocalculaceae archaeon]
MDEAEKIVTIVGSVLAREGAEFVYAGMIAACEVCKVRNVCHRAKLKDGRRYRVTVVRPAKHECSVHEGGAVVVEVTEAQITAVIPARSAAIRTRITYTPVCGDRFCKGYVFCHPDGMIEAGRYVVLEILGSYDEMCPKGKKHLKLAELRSVPT